MDDIGTLHFDGKSATAKALIKSCARLSSIRRRELWGFFRTSAFAALALLPLLAILCVSGVSLAAPLDFDQDGLSDRLVVQIQNDGDLRWRAKGDGANTNLGVSGKVGDHLIVGNWIASSAPVVGYVRSASGQLTWGIRSGGQEQSVLFGTPSDLVISGGDFNGDGITDAAITKRARRRMRWQVNVGLFSSGSTSTFRHGRFNDIAFFMDVNGRRDGAAVLQRPDEGKYRILVRDLVSGKVKKINRISRSLRNFGRPSPLSDSTGRDVLVFTRRGSSTTAVTVIGRNGRRIMRTQIPEAADTVIGDFLSDPGEEFAFATESGFQAFNPFSETSATLEAPPGIATDLININAFSTNDDGSLPPPRGTCYDQDATDGAKVGFIWKPTSDTQFGAVVILPGTYLNKVSSVKSMTRSGNEIRTLSFKGNANPDPGGRLRPHYIDRTMVGSNYRSQYRSIDIEVALTNGACLRYPIDNPALRVD